MEWKGHTGIEIPLLPAGVIMFAGSKEEFISWAEKNGKKLRNIAAHVMSSSGPSAMVKGYTINDGALSLILVPRFDAADEECVANLYHEALHVALAQLRRLGVEIGEDGEILAYMQEYIVKNLLKMINETTKGE